MGLAGVFVHEYPHAAMRCSRNLTEGHDQPSKYPVDIDPTLGGELFQRID